MHIIIISEDNDKVSNDIFGFFFDIWTEKKQIFNNMETKYIYKFFKARDMRHHWASLQMESSIKNG